MNAQRAAWLFLTPALLVLGVFFLLPVIAALALSLTDYDLYALANIHNLRFVALQNYWHCCSARCFGRRSDIRCISWRSVCRCRWVPHSALRCC